MKTAISTIYLVLAVISPAFAAENGSIQKWNSRQRLCRCMCACCCRPTGSSSYVTSGIH